MAYFRVDIRMGFLERGRQWSITAIFSAFGRYMFETFRDEAVRDLFLNFELGAWLVTRVRVVWPTRRQTLTRR